MKNTAKNQFVSIIIVIMMCFAMLPLNSFASDELQNDNLIVQADTSEQAAPEAQADTPPNDINSELIQISSQNITSPVSADLSASNVLDWIHFNNAETPNRMDTATPILTASYVDAKVDYNPAIVTDIVNFGTSYSNGKNPVQTSNSNTGLVVTGLDSTFDFEAASKNGVERQLVLDFNSWAGKNTIITATMGAQTIEYTPYDYDINGRNVRYVISYTGTELEEPLKVNFTLKDVSMDPIWACIGFTSAFVTEGEPEPEPEPEPDPDDNNSDITITSQNITSATDNNLSASNVLDWIHFNNAETPNRMDTVTPILTTSYVDTKVDFPPSIVTDIVNFKTSYSNGKSPVQTSNSNAGLVVTGLDSTFDFEVASKNGVERKLILDFNSWAGKNTTITATMGAQTIEYTPYDYDVNGRNVRYVISYTGTELEEPLKVNFTLKDVSMDPLWACIGFTSASVTEGEPEPPKPEIKFTNTSFTGNNAIYVPASDSNKRRLNAAYYDAQGNVVQSEEVVYELIDTIDGITLQDNLITVSSSVLNDTTIQVKASLLSDPTVFTLTNVEIKTGDFEDTPTKEIGVGLPGDDSDWVLFHSDEFDQNELDPAVWSEYYLRHWSDDDDKAKGDYYFDNGNLVIKADEGIEPWSHQDGPIKVEGITTYETQYLHKFGPTSGGAQDSREIPDFDGLATKYGYFEIRLKMPNTRDGSHFAWWMTGVQEDMNMDPNLANSGKFEGRYTNEGGEFDIIEQTIQYFDGMKSWRPVIHPNGTSDFNYLHVPSSYIEGDPSNEYNVYGFEWDENGTKFYLNDVLVQSTDRSPNYPMMTYFNIYAEGGMGDDLGIYPKEAYIDYFRIYKRNEPSQAQNIVLNDGSTPDYIEVFDDKSNEVQMNAKVYDQFDNHMPEETVKWRLLKTIDLNSHYTSSNSLPSGVTIDEITGVISVEPGTALNQDIFVNAFISDEVNQTYHIKLSTAESKPVKVLFNNPIEIAYQNTTLDLSAKLYDQYKNVIDAQVVYSLSDDITAREEIMYPGVTIDANGLLSVDGNAETGKVIVTAKSGNYYNNVVVEIAQSTITEYIVTTDVNDENAGTAQGDATVQAGESVTVSATPDTGYKFVNWTIGEEIVSTSSTYTFTPENNTDIVANFANIKYSITVVNGTTKNDKDKANYNKKMTITATVPEGYNFVEWQSDDGVVFEDANAQTTTFLMPANDVTVTAVIAKEITFTFIAENGIVTGDSKYKAEVTTSPVKAQLPEVTPNIGYNFKGWSVDQKTVSEDATYDKDTVFVAVFEEKSEGSYDRTNDFRIPKFSYFTPNYNIVLEIGEDITIGHTSTGFLRNTTLKQLSGDNNISASEMLYKHSWFNANYKWNVTATDFGSSVYATRMSNSASLNYEKYTITVVDTHTLSFGDININVVQTDSNGVEFTVPEFVGEHVFAVNGTSYRVGDKINVTSDLTFETVG